jgi:hypothetical protein
VLLPAHPTSNAHLSYVSTQHTPLILTYKVFKVPPNMQCSSCPKRISRSHPTYTDTPHQTGFRCSVFSMLTARDDGSLVDWVSPLGQMGHQCMAPFMVRCQSATARIRWCSEPQAYNVRACMVFAMAQYNLKRRRH